MLLVQVTWNWSGVYKVFPDNVVLKPNIDNRDIVKWWTHTWVVDGWWIYHTSTIHALCRLIDLSYVNQKFDISWIILRLWVIWKRYNISQSLDGVFLAVIQLHIIWRKCLSRLYVYSLLGKKQCATAQCSFQVLTPRSYANYAASARKDVIMITIVPEQVKYLNSDNKYTNLRTSNWNTARVQRRLQGCSDSES